MSYPRHQTVGGVGRPTREAPQKVVDQRLSAEKTHTWPVRCIATRAEDRESRGLYTLLRNDMTCFLLARVEHHLNPTPSNWCQPVSPGLKLDVEVPGNWRVLPVPDVQFSCCTQYHRRDSRLRLPGSSRCIGGKLRLLRHQQNPKSGGRRHTDSNRDAIPSCLGRSW